MTRRSFLRTSSAGAVGVASAAAFGPMLAPGGARDRDDWWDDDHDGRVDDGALVSIRDAAAGEVELLVGDRSIVFTDRRLVSRIARQAR